MFNAFLDSELEVGLGFTDQFSQNFEKSFGLNSGSKIGAY